MYLRTRIKYLFPKCWRLLLKVFCPKSLHPSKAWRKQDIQQFINPVGQIPFQFIQPFSLLYCCFEETVTTSSGLCREVTECSEQHCFPGRVGSPAGKKVMFASELAVLVSQKQRLHARLKAILSNFSFSAEYMRELLGSLSSGKEWSWAPMLVL